VAYYDHKPRSSDDPPSLSGPIFCIVLFSWLALMQVYGLMTWHGFLGFSPGWRVLWLLFDALMVWGFVGSYKRTIRRRSDMREEKYRNFILGPALPELEPATDWAEIERGVSELLSTGVDPTYERAKDFLRLEAEHEQFDQRYQANPYARSHPKHLIKCPECAGWHYVLEDGKCPGKFRAREREQEHHPYGTDPKGLIDQCRVEMEQECRKQGRTMPPLVERLKAAEQMARLRWPHYFDR
jgi:hypothetical protein